MSAEGGYTSVAFPSHVRTAFTKSGAPCAERHDATGELVRLLDDLGTEFRWVAARVRETRSARGATAAVDAPITPSLVTQQLYHALCHDGYACLIVSRDEPDPMPLPPDMPHGSYVIVLASLEYDEVAGTAGDGVIGSLFSVYKRRTTPGRAGRKEDMQVQLAGQVAAGYALYGSSTQMCYAMRGNPGVYRFVLHPVAKQFFMCSATAMTFGKENVSGIALGMDDKAMRQAANNGAEAVNGQAVATTPPVRLLCPRGLLLRGDALGAALRAFVERHGCGVIYTGSIVDDFHSMLMAGGVMVTDAIDLLCEAGPLAYLAEETGARAVDDSGARVLDRRLSGSDPLHVPVRVLLGAPELIEELQTGMRDAEKERR
ncbi:hypothetical protein CDCA_CDCA01G0034 [Cyanidium caldarium]|uniref:Fructose-bisphosphatase n=1 Tax=Cyanidium caldarium TaxID=2771 RepID=A0AAV9IP33_CYACA|nr:hypothetical protein CDCA_CDCA01G0034 [Cyanidium caldarium]|eukprot:ctg_1163.g414